MILKRLTKIEKDEIIEAYRGGEHTNKIAEKYCCSSNTINRTVKTMLSDVEYKLLKGKRSKSSNKRLDRINKETFEGDKKDLLDQNILSIPEPKVDKQSIVIEEEVYNPGVEEITVLPLGDFPSTELQNNENPEIDKINQTSENKLEEIVPLISSFDFEIHNQEILPESVYMLVDKKVELEIKAISDLPEWSFLPENELRRNAILLFSNQRSAKRNCSRNQRVIKIPNTSVFNISKPYLFLKGITRLILEDSIIALDI